MFEEFFFLDSLVESWSALFGSLEIIGFKRSRVELILSEVRSPCGHVLRVNFGTDPRSSLGSWLSAPSGVSRILSRAKSVFLARLSIAAYRYLVDSHRSSRDSQHPAAKKNNGQG